MNRRREKLVNAFVFFISNTKICGTTKIMKLLNFFEFEHFNQTGVPPIGLEYKAYSQGPMSEEFWVEINKGSLTSDFSNVADVKEISYSENIHGYLFTPKAGVVPDMSVFTPREQKIMEDVARTYCYTTATDMSEISHRDKSPWYRTNQEKGNRAPIDYLYAITGDSPIGLDLAKEKLDNFNAVNRVFDIEATIPEW